MKNLNAKHALYLPLIIASIFCTIYLNTQAINIEGPLQETELFDAEELEDKEEIQAPLLDVRLIQQVYETGKKFIPVKN